MKKWKKTDDEWWEHAERGDELFFDYYEDRGRTLIGVVLRQANETMKQAGTFDNLVLTKKEAKEIAKGYMGRNP